MYEDFTWRVSDCEELVGGDKNIARWMVAPSTGRFS
jgi:hypothetical protein